ncbi:helix-turn-helix domain-containing protein [Aquimarina mytili]|uniref:AraC family transcriptional regulator n=1 Tax=Aquimarina mytili TaxID=874423 RepID=A0A937DAN0_9FLAO|nr:helix-turn-helix domain-containing protein [Aquimarina mytili]MBL0686170.1 AraC family transcriptional regulator [Aquimarina mytili]
MQEIIRHSIDKFKQQVKPEFEEKNFFLKEFINDNELFEEPYRTETFGIGYLKEGQFVLTTGLTNHTIDAPSLITMGPNVIRKWTRTYKPVINYTIFFTSDFLSSILSSNNKLLNVPYFEEADLHIFHLNDSEKNSIESIFDTLKNFIESDYKNKNEFIRLQTAILCEILDEFHTKRAISNSKTHQNPLAYKFKHLAARDIKVKRDVTYYAEKLNTTTKKLTKVIKKVTGKTASQFLQDLLILEAKILLQDGNATINQIAYELNFPDPSTFGKYFKKNIGKTPSAYREEFMTI